MPLTILTDSNVQDLLHNLTKQDVESLQASLQNALHEYSTGTTNAGACAQNQPNRTAMESKSGTTTLFMPSTSATGIGMKVVTLADPPSSSSDPHPTTAKTNVTPQGALTIMDNSGKPTGFLNAEEVTAFRTALASSLLITRRSRVKTITVFGVGKQAFWHVRLSLLLHGHTIKRVHFINREFNDRARDCLKKFIGFDASVKKEEGWYQTTFDLISTSYNEIGRVLKDQVRAADIIFSTTPSTEPLFDDTILTNTEGRKKGRLIIAVGSYKKHMIEIPTEVIFQAVKRHGSGHHFHKHAEEGGVVVVDTLACLTETGELVGIQPHQSVELGELVMLEHMSPRTSDSASDSPIDSSRASLETLESLSLNNDGTKSLAKVFREDSMESNSSTTTSTTKSSSRKSSFTNLAKPSFNFHKRSGSAGSGSTERGSLGRKKKQSEQEDQMSRWLSSGNVIYKSVGMGLMDLVVGGDLVRLAREKGVGLNVEDF